ncbi:MAG: hypothetical protein K6F87_08390 [Lachnospiraceae bacterium]|nr:hypothetical protein [Lachnospiraceae bacterium]
MTAIKEKELYTVNGGAENAQMLGGPKFKEGDIVRSKSQKDMGAGTVTGKKYSRGWHYYVSIGKGKIYAPESDLERVLLQ